MTSELKLLDSLSGSPPSSPFSSSSESSDAFLISASGAVVYEAREVVFGSAEEEEEDEGEGEWSRSMEGSRVCISRVVVA